MRLCKGNSGVKNKGVPSATKKLIKDYAAQGVISMKFADGTTRENESALYELVDKNYKFLDGYRYKDSGNSENPHISYRLYQRLPNGRESREDIFPYPKSITTESARRGFLKLQIYNREGRLLDKNDKVIRPLGHWNDRYSVDNALKKGQHVPSSILKYYYPDGVK